MSVVPALLLAGLAPPVSPLVLHVSPRGDDGWSGRSELPTADGRDGPLATLSRAQQVARSILAQGREVALTVRLAAGVHRLARPLVFGPQDGASGNGQVTWEGAAGERVVLSGGRSLDDWDLAQDGTWSHTAPSPAPRQLFVVDQRRPRARTPDEGWLRVAAAGPDGRTSLTYAPGDLRAWPDLEGAELLFLHDWSISRVGIRSVDEQARSVRLAHRIGARHPFFRITGFEAHPRYRVENLRAAWDRAGEWYLERARGRIHYRPQPGEDPGSCRAVVPVLEQLLSVRGEQGRPVRGLRFVGLTFAHTRAADPPGGFAGVQASFHEDRSGPGQPAGNVAPPAAVRVNHAQECLFERCRFEHLGGTGLWLGEGSRDSRVQACTFTDIGANGLMIGEPGEERALAARIVCADNLVEHCGRIDFGSVGVWVGIAAEVSIRHNEVRDLPYTGISLGWIWDPRPSPSRGHRIERNHIHHVMQTLSDGGGIYTLGRQAGTVVGHNLIHDIAPNQGRAPSNGIFVDEGSSELVFEHNVIHSLARAPIRFHRAGRNVLRRNVLVAEGGVSAFAYAACSAEDEVFEDNEVPDPRTWSPPSRREFPVGPR